MIAKDGLWKVFIAFVAMWHRFLSSAEWKMERKQQMIKTHGTNLCHMVRIILIWTPLVVVSHLLVFGYVIYTLTVLPATLFGLTAYLSTIGIAALACGIVTGFFYAMYRYEEVLDSKVEKALTHTSSAYAAVRAHVPRIGFFAAIWQYAKALKQGICPKILPPPQTEITNG